MDVEESFRQELRALIAGVMPGRENALVFGEYEVRFALLDAARELTRRLTD